MEWKKCVFIQSSEQKPVGEHHPKPAHCFPLEYFWIGLALSRRVRQQPPVRLVPFICSEQHGHTRENMSTFLDFSFFSPVPFLFLLLLFFWLFLRACRIETGGCQMAQQSELLCLSLGSWGMAAKGCVPALCTKCSQPGSVSVVI